MCDFVEIEENESTEIKFLIFLKNNEKVYFDRPTKMVDEMIRINFLKIFFLSAVEKNRCLNPQKLL